MYLRMKVKLHPKDSAMRISPDTAQKISGLSVLQFRDLIRVQGKGKKKDTVLFKPQWPSQGQGLPNEYSFGDCMHLALISYCRKAKLARIWIERFIELVDRINFMTPKKNPFSLHFFEEEKYSPVHKHSPQVYIELLFQPNWYVCRFRTYKDGNEIGGWPEEAMVPISYDHKTSYKITDFDKRVPQSEFVDTYYEREQTLRELIEDSAFKVSINLNKIHTEVRMKL